MPKKIFVNLFDVQHFKESVLSLKFIFLSNWCYKMETNDL